MRAVGVVEFGGPEALQVVDVPEAHAGIGEITRHLWPLMCAAFTVVLLITYLPELSLWLPRLIQGW